MKARITAELVALYEVAQDITNPNDWIVEGFDPKAGDVFVAIFSGPESEERAVEYASFKNSQ